MDEIVGFANAISKLVVVYTLPDGIVPNVVIVCNVLSQLVIDIGLRPILRCILLSGQVLK